MFAAAAMARRGLDFFLRIWRLTDGTAGFAVLLGLLASLTEGISLALLIPMVAAVQGGAAIGGQDIPIIGSLLNALRFDLTTILILFTALVILQAFLVRASSLYSVKTLFRATDRLRRNFFTSVGRARWDVVQERKVSDLSHILTNEIGRSQVAINTMLSLIQSTFLLAIYFALALLVSWQMAVFALGIGIVLFAILYPIRRKASRFGEEMSGLYAVQHATQLEFLTGMRVAKSFGAEDRYIDRFWQRLGDIRRKTVEFTELTSWGNLLLKALSTVAAALFVWIAVTIVDIDLARLLILLVILLRIAPRFGVIQEMAQNFLNNLPAFDNVQRSMSELDAAAEPPPRPGQGMPEFQREIRFEGVSLAYHGTHRPVVSGIDLSLAANRVTALIGPSGSGKSTIADLFMGLLHPTAGTISVDGTPLTDENRRLWREQVAFVPQEPFLLNDTIEANLRIADPDATQDQMREALRTAKALDFIEKLPDGLATHVGERGTRFSGGERQRISLARALLRKPRLLILDEATSALDWENQRVIARDIAEMRGKLTILTIAHRPSMIDFADDVIALEAGRVVEAGSFAELAADPESRLARMLRGEGHG